MSKNFSFSGEERALLAASLGRSSDHFELRAVEQIVNQWADYNEKHILADLSRNDRIGAAAEKLLLEIELSRDDDGNEGEDFERDYDEDGNPVTLRGHLMVAIDFRDLVKKEHDHVLPKGRPPVIPRMLATRLLEFWENSGRSIARSSTATKDSPDVQIPSGPLVRFLLAATEPVLRTKVPLGAAEHAIRTFYPRRRTEGDAKFSEFVRRLIADGPHGESAAEK